MLVDPVAPNIKRHSVKEEGGGKRAQQEIFQRSLAADRRPAPESGQNVSGNRGNFQRNEDQHQLDRRRHQAHADRAEENQRVILTRPDPLHFHVFVRAENDDSRDRGNQDVEEDAERIHLDHAPESQARVLRLVERGSNRRDRADQGDGAQQPLAPALIHQRIEHHDEHAKEGKHDLRQDDERIPPPAAKSDRFPRGSLADHLAGQFAQTAPMQFGRQDQWRSARASAPLPSPARPRRQATVQFARAGPGQAMSRLPGCVTFPKNTR